MREEATGSFSKTGKLLFLDGFIVDITEQKLIEEALQNENVRLRSSLCDNISKVKAAQEKEIKI